MDMHGAELAFAHYSRAQVARAMAILDSHIDDGRGRCRECGELAPCPDCRHGKKLILHYGQFVAVTRPDAKTRHRSARQAMVFMN